MIVNTNFWNDKKVFLTGHTGFKGSWLSLWLHSMKADVTGYSLAPVTNPSLFKDARLEDGMNSVFADIRDLDKLKNELKMSKAEIVFHLAAQPLVGASYQDPVETFQTNVMGTVNLLEAVRHAPNVRAVVIVTSDKCYENKEWSWAYRENDPMGGHDPYSASKGCSELVAASFAKSFFSTSVKSNVSVASARAGNVIGGGDWSDTRLVPDIVRAIMKEQKVIIRNPKAVRPWQHVLEPLAGYLSLAEKLFQDGAKFAESWNFGPQDSDAREVEWIVKNLIQMWGHGSDYVIDNSTSVGHEAHYLRLDCGKAKLKLGWEPQWDLKTSLAKIVEWNKSYLKNADNAREITLSQIDEYMKFESPK